MRLTFVLILFLMPAAVPAQKAGPELVASAGDFFENDGISLSWSFGELAIETCVKDEFIITNGFQQSLTEITSIRYLRNPLPRVNAYPNPSTGNVWIELSPAFQHGDLRIDVTGTDGHLLLNSHMESTEFRKEIDIGRLENGIYILRITSEEQNLQRTFRIVKLD